ncbi:TniQ family protein [Rhodopseudomonas sp. B29]|uniref:TniQ family protein n=1 Tax=Rhodopseudomonas sp. B29 TaxID=95607 RepID=UPI00034972D2|nr:TniQ family protein [Rhodopseudomonas sp. B29]
MNYIHSKMAATLRDGESPMSFSSRAGQLLGRTARDFCLDMGFSFQAVVDGNQGALGRIAACCRVDLSRLSDAAIVKVGDRRYRIRQQEVVRDSLARSSMRVCPVCLHEDLEFLDGPRDVRPYGRTLWQIGSIRTCPRHNAALVQVVEDDNPHRVHDFALLIKPSLDALPELIRASKERPLSGLESYLCERLLHPEQMQPRWLNRLPFYAAARASEMLGAVASRGIRFYVNSLTEDDWHACGGRGYEIAESGEDGIRSLLSDLQDSFRATKHDWGPRSIFGRLYEWLAHEISDEAYAPLRSLITRHVIDTMPVGPGDEIFGKPVESRTLHSLHSASLEFGAHPKRLRKLLLAADVIKADCLDRSDDRILFEAERAQPFLERIEGAMSLKEAGKYINAPRPHERLLFEAGFIQPFIRGRTDRLKNHAFAKQDLDAFLARLLDGSLEGDQGGHLLPIPDAARRANCAAMEIVRLLLDGSLERVARRPDVSGYLSVLVDPVEVGRHVRGPELHGLTLRSVEKVLRTSSATVKALIKGNHLPSGEMLNPVNRCPQTYVREDALKDFMERFASIDVLARELGTRGHLLRPRLDAMTIDPAFVLSDVNVPFYDRRTLPKTLSETNASQT